jgi:hypothetical protein
LTATDVSVTVFRMSKTATAIPKQAAATPLKKRSGFRIKSTAHRLSAARKPLRYDAEDIEEANRIGTAICRQHAR